MKRISIILLLVILGITTAFISNTTFIETDKSEINATVNTWHKAAAEANFEAYFGAMTTDAIFIGTDATENWSLPEFKAYAKPHFDKGKAWNFATLERNIFVSEKGDVAWFDELLDTQMKICRGSGVLKRVNGEWKIAHYVLSITIPNDNVNEVIKLKNEAEDKLITILKSKQ